MQEFNGYLLTENETTALTNLLKEIREKEEYHTLVKQCKMSISSSISDAIDKIGIAEAKHIVRALMKELP